MTTPMKFADLWVHSASLPPEYFATDNKAAEEKILSHFLESCWFYFGTPTGPDAIVTVTISGPKRGLQIETNPEEEYRQRDYHDFAKGGYLHNSWYNRALFRLLERIEEADPLKDAKNALKKFNTQKEEKETENQGGQIPRGGFPVGWGAGPLLKNVLGRDVDDPPYKAPADTFAFGRIIAVSAPPSQEPPVVVAPVVPPQEETPKAKKGKKDKKQKVKKTKKKDQK